MAATAVAKKANESVAHQKWMSVLNNASNLSGRVGDLERMVGFLQDMLKESGDLMMGIVDGTIPVAGHPVSGSSGTAGMATRADFESYECTEKLRGKDTLLDL